VIANYFLGLFQKTRLIPHPSGFAEAFYFVVVAVVVGF